MLHEELPEQVRHHTAIVLGVIVYLKGDGILWVYGFAQNLFFGPIEHDFRDVAVKVQGVHLLLVEPDQYEVTVAVGGKIGDARIHLDVTFLEVLLPDGTEVPSGDIELEYRLGLDLLTVLGALHAQDIHVISRLMDSHHLVDGSLPVIESENAHELPGRVDEQEAVTFPFGHHRCALPARRSGGTPDRLHVDRRGPRFADVGTYQHERKYGQNGQQDLDDLSAFLFSKLFHSPSPLPLRSALSCLGSPATVRLTSQGHPPTHGRSHR